MQVFSTLRHAAAFSALLLMFIDPARAAEQKPSHGSVDLSMGSEDVHLQGHCLRMSATIADSSLAKLHKKRTTTGIEFVRGKTPVDQYPDELMVEVTVTDCASPYSVPVDATFCATCILRQRGAVETTSDRANCTHRIRDSMRRKPATRFGRSNSLFQVQTSP